MVLSFELSEKFNLMSNYGINKIRNENRGYCSSDKINKRRNRKDKIGKIS